MSIASSPDYLFRPEDKALQILFPSVEEGNNFDEFFNEELYNSSQHPEDSNESPDDLFSRQPYVSDYPRLPSLSGSTTQERSSPQPWRKGLWCLNQAQPTKLNVEKTRKIGMGTISTAHLVNNDNFAIRSSRSPAVSPAVNTTKRFATSPNAANYFHKAHPHPDLTRGYTVPESHVCAATNSGQDGAGRNVATGFSELSPQDATAVLLHIAHEPFKTPEWNCS